jgi:hypothetical protein
LPLGGLLVFRLRRRSWSQAGGSFQRRALEMVWGMAAQIKVRQMHRKRYKSLSHVLIAGPSPIGVVLCRQCGDKRDGLSAHEVSVGERPVCHPASVSSGWG